MTTKETGAGGFRPHDPQGDHQRHGDDMPVAGSPQCQKIPTKWKRVLEALLTGRTVNRFEAERPVHEGGLSDHCLPSTVSDLQRKGIRIERRQETVRGYMGAPCECARYWIDLQDAANVAKARELLNPTATPSSHASTPSISGERWARALRHAEQERRDRAARGAS
jgi:hypothetical protein